MIDLPTTTPILKSIFGGPDYLVTGAGGDLCLPGAIEYQTLHADFRERYELPEARLEQARRVGVRSAHRWRKRRAGLPRAATRSSSARRRGWRSIS